MRIFISANQKLRGEFFPERYPVHSQDSITVIKVILPIIITIINIILIIIFAIIKNECNKITRVWKLN